MSPPFGYEVERRIMAVGCHLWCKQWPTREVFHVTMLDGQTREDCHRVIIKITLYFYTTSKYTIILS
jgi:hypothetical protein